MRKFFAFFALLLAGVILVGCRKKVKLELELKTAPALTLEVGQKKTVEAKVNGGSSRVLLKTSDKTVVKVNGLEIEALKQGDAVIKVYLEEDESISADIRVKVLNPELTLTKTEVSLKVGKNFKIEYTLANYSGIVTFTSVDQAIAKVDQTGLVTALKAGETKVKVKILEIEKEVVVKVSDLTITDVSELTEGTSVEIEGVVVLVSADYVIIQDHNEAIFVRGTTDEVKATLELGKFLRIKGVVEVNENQKRIRVENKADVSLAEGTKPGPKKVNMLADLTPNTLLELESVLVDELTYDLQTMLDTPTELTIKTAFAGKTVNVFVNLDLVKLSSPEKLRSFQRMSQNSKLKSTGFVTEEGEDYKFTVQEVELVDTDLNPKFILIKQNLENEESLLYLGKKYVAGQNAFKTLHEAKEKFADDVEVMFMAGEYEIVPHSDGETSDATYLVTTNRVRFVGPNYGLDPRLLKEGGTPRRLAEAIFTKPIAFLGENSQNITLDGISFTTDGRILFNPHAGEQNISVLNIRFDELQNKAHPSSIIRLTIFNPDKTPVAIENYPLFNRENILISKVYVNGHNGDFIQGTNTGNLTIEKCYFNVVNNKLQATQAFRGTGVSSDWIEGSGQAKNFPNEEKAKGLFGTFNFVDNEVNGITQRFIWIDRITAEVVNITGNVSNSFGRIYQKKANWGSLFQFRGITYNNNVFNIENNIFRNNIAWGAVRFNGTHFNTVADKAPVVNLKNNYFGEFMALNNAETEFDPSELKFFSINIKHVKVDARYSYFSYYTKFEKDPEGDNHVMSELKTGLRPQDLVTQYEEHGFKFDLYPMFLDKNKFKTHATDNDFDAVEVDLKINGESNAFKVEKGTSVLISYNCKPKHHLVYDENELLNIDSDRVINISEEPLKVKVTLNLHGGDGSGAGLLSEYLINVDTVFANPGAPTYEGHNFKHWSLTDGGTEYDFTKPVTGNITLHAVWEIKRYNVTINLQGGTFNGSTDDVVLSLAHGSALPVNPESVLVAVTKPGNTLKHWSLTEGGDKFELTTPITGEITLYAVWE